ncbi:MAG TPA: hypothetical protein VKX33_04000 [Cyclobacteriaceae bacterium]|nr:hypothetical protein [Cyclobacteriaceae bacterium]
MAIYSSFRLLLKHPLEITHIFYSMLGTVCIFFSPLYGQGLEISINAYRTALEIDGTGDWDDPFTWEVWDGSSWRSATIPPSRDNDVFIEKDNEVRLTQNQEVGTLYLFAAAEAGKKLNLQAYDLDVYGALRCFFRDTDGKYQFYSSTSGITDWIYPEIGSIVFKGSSRNIVDRSSWSANTQYSRFGVIFNPDPHEALTVNAGFKANNFTVLSGTVIQTVNTEGTEATSTFSFNTHDMFGTDNYGEFIVEPGATLISYGTKEFNEIIRRSDTRPASNFHLKEGGRLILLGQEPIIEAANILLEGDVYYSGNSGTQRFITGSMDGVTEPSEYNNLFFEGNAIKNLPEILELTGNFTHLDGGSIIGTNTSLYFIGNDDQEVVQTSLHLKEAIINKPAGLLILDGDLVVNERFEMVSGDVDFRHHNLAMNGLYSYHSGHWRNLSLLTHQNLPTALLPSNSTFPFIDAYLGGKRTVILIGNLSVSNTGLRLSYTELPGVNWDAGFNDYDNTPILYKLNSYFTVDLNDVAAEDKLEIRISADNLIVVRDEDLRIVSDISAAPPDHLPGLNNIARRELSTLDLKRQILTIGSTGIASILPIAWLSYGARQFAHGNLVSWSTAQERNNREFLVFKSIDAKQFDEIGGVTGTGYSNEIQHYDFLDRTLNTAHRIYYQIKQVDFDGRYDFSPVFDLSLAGSDDRISIFPNPSVSQRNSVTIRIPEKLRGTPAQMSVKHISGISLVQEAGLLEEVAVKIAEHMDELSPGMYLVIVENHLKQQVVKWLKEN